VVEVAFVVAAEESRPCSFELEEASFGEYSASSAVVALVVPLQVVVGELASVAEEFGYSQTYSRVPRQQHCVLEVVWLANTLEDSDSCEWTRRDTRS